MSSPYFFTDPASLSENWLTLGPADVHHLHVRRAAPGDLIVVGDGAGRVCEARIESIDRRSAAAEVISVRHVPRSSPRVTVLQALAKASKVDWVVEKLVELGVDSIAIFTSRRSVPSWDEAKKAAAAERWNRLARAAAKQSRRAWLPELQGPLELDRAVAMVAQGFTLVADPGAEGGLRKALEGETPEEVFLVIGPEGGLENSEVEAFAGVGARAVDLGSQILRTETAPLVFASMVMYELGRLG